MSQNVIGCTFQWSVWTLVNGSFDSHWAHDPQVENHWSIRRHTCSFIDLRTSRVTAGPSLAGSTWFKSLTTTVVLCWRWGNDAFESFYSCNEGQVSSFEILEFSRNALSLTDHHFLGCVCGGGGNHPFPGVGGRAAMIHLAYGCVWIFSYSLAWAW